IVADTVSEVDLSDKVTLSSATASWRLFNERVNEQYFDKTASNLRDGSNKFSLLVDYANGSQVKTYQLEIYKKYEITVEVYDAKNKPMPEYDYKLMALDVFTAPKGVEIEGYTLNGWNAGTGKIGEPLPKNASHTIKITANATPNTYTVTLDADGGTVSDGNKKAVTYGKSAQLGKPTKTNSVFGGWYLDDVQVANKDGYCKEWTYAENKTLTAKWTVYTVTTNTNLEGAGSFTQMDEEAVAVGSTVKLEATTWDKGVWIGWFEGEERVSANKTYSFRMTEKSRTLTAKWGRLVLTWDNDAGYVKDFSVWQSHYYLDGQKIDLTAVTRPGYAFVGWFDEKGEKVGEDFDVTLTANDEDKTYRPKWSKVTLAKNIDDAGKVTDLSKATYVVGDSIEVSAVTALGYNFLGWFDGEEKVSDELSFTIEIPSEDKTYTAQWSFYTVKINADVEDGGKASMSFTVDFDVNGGEGEIESQTATPQRGWRYPELPTREGYVFKGWFTEPECENIYNFELSTPTHNMTLYAGWEEMTAEAPKHYQNLQTTKRKAIDLRDYDSQDYGHTFEQNLMGNSWVYNYNYFTALYNGSIRFGYRAAVDELVRGHSGIYIYIYNETQQTEPVQIKPIAYNSDSSANNTVYWQYSEIPNVKMGDVLYIRIHAQGIYAPTLRMYFNAYSPVTYSVRTDDAKISVGEETTLSAVTKEGYTFVGWYNGDEKVTADLNYTFTMTAENREYTAKWVKAVVLATNDEEAGSVDGDNVVSKVGDEITLTATSNKGYTFVGWYENDTLVGDHEKAITVTVTDTQKVYTAKWIKVTLEKNIEEAGSITEGLNVSYVYDESVTVTAATNIGYVWLGWYEGDEKVCTELSYPFSMPDASTTLTATWELCTSHTPNEDCVCSKCGKIAHTPDENCECTQCHIVDHSTAMQANGYCRHTENGTNYIYMGYYPQTIKAEDVTVSEVTDSDGYYGGSDGERYAKVTVIRDRSGYK
ncbi:MAG: InlB B-repeat-containing protein, partial [Clostridia bacterium]|nr:InlB B-repeat-containing protein [Clostridia bacterium]